MRRFLSLKYWLLGRKNNVSFFEILLYVVTPPFGFLGKRKISSIFLEDNFYKVELKGFSIPLFWPKAFPLHSLYQIATELLYKNWWNYEVDYNRVEKDDVVVDCGAAEGAFTLQVMGRCKKVFAIEPSDDFIKSMKKTFLGVNNIDILPIGVGDKKGFLKLSTNGIMSKLDTDEGILVEIDTIDALFYERNIKPDFIKADLEGFELNMLMGAENTIKKWKPKLSITTYHNEKDYENISNYLKKICKEYTIVGRGITDSFGTPVMLHAWIN